MLINELQCWKYDVGFEKSKNVFELFHNETGSALELLLFC